MNKLIGGRQCESNVLHLFGERNLLNPQTDRNAETAKVEPVSYSGVQQNEPLDTGKSCPQEAKTVRTIPVGAKHVTVVDDADYAMLSSHRWHPVTRNCGKVYARASIKGKPVTMHRLLMNVTDSKIIVDHANGDSLDNCRGNLRIATAQQNCWNSRKTTKPKMLKYKGVYVGYWRSQTPIYKARIMVNSKVHHLGYFETQEEAANAYNEAAMRFFGEFASLNEVPLKGERIPERGRD